MAIPKSEIHNSDLVLPSCVSFHLLPQRPVLTGSGITLDAIDRLAAVAGHDQRVVVGVPADDPHPDVGLGPRLHSPAR